MSRTVTHRVAEVYREHLPAGRYNLGPRAHDSVIDPGASEHAMYGHGVPRRHSHLLHTTNVDHRSHLYRSVSDGMYGAEFYSAVSCGLFALLAVIQLAIAAHMLLVLAPALARSSNATSHASGWVRGKARWVAALVPGAVARCCALLLLIADLSAKAGGLGPGDVTFLFDASSFFDAAASWLFYTFKVAALTGWAMSLHGPGRDSQRLLMFAALASLTLGLALAVTVSRSLSYGSLCLETHDVGMCRERQMWYATFHVVMVAISVCSIFYFGSLLLSGWRQVHHTSRSAGAGCPPRVSGGSSSVMDVFAAVADKRVVYCRDGSEARVAAHEARVLMPAAHTCAASICWWCLFNMWGALRAARLLAATPSAVEMAVSANWILSEFIPGLVIALVIFFQVRRETGRVLTEVDDARGHDVGRVGPGSYGLFRQDSELRLIQHPLR